MDRSTTRITVFLHCPYRVYREGVGSVAQDKASRFEARCDSLEVAAANGTAEDALLQLAKVLQVEVHVAIARGKLNEVIRKLTGATPERPVVSSSATAPPEVLIDGERKEILIPVA